MRQVSQLLASICVPSARHNGVLWNAYAASDYHRLVTRAPVPPETQAKVLLQSRRRCCICFGLNRDTSLKSGQIAHLDRNSANSAEDNLAFLCFEHHDQYDSPTSQRKNFTILEVKAHRDELHKALKEAFSTPVAFGHVNTRPGGGLEGHYVRVGGGDSADIKLTTLPGRNRYHVSGIALHGEGRQYGPNIGELDFIGELEGDTLRFSQKRLGDDEVHSVVLQFAEGKLSVTEENEFGMHGLGVTFNGPYERAPE